MTKRIICCENPSYINIKDKQLQIRLKNDQNNPITESVEDIGILIIDNAQITITSMSIQELQENKVALLICDNKHMPSGLMLPVNGNCIQQARVESQIKLKQSLKSSLWKQIIIKKIKNQSILLESLSINSTKLNFLSEQVKSGDHTNREAQASVYYWKNIFKEHIIKFQRDKNGECPNNFLNYGYTILRTVMAKHIVSAGLIPSMGIFHKNKFNAFSLADDLMEPFRPFVDKIIYNIVKNNGIKEDLTKEHKKLLLEIPLLQINSKNENTTLTLAMQNLVNSFVRFLQKETEELDFPEF